MPDNKHVCPVERADSLDSKIRRWLQNPRKILSPYIKEGMTVMDFGCGPGYFTIDMAQMVGKSGKVIAADLQDGMLQKVKAKFHNTELEERITLHKTGGNEIGLSEKLDFVLVFYVMHELPDQTSFFKELGLIMNPGGQVLIVEPPFHVSKSAFAESVEKARKVGFIPAKGPRMFLSKTVILKKN